MPEGLDRQRGGDPGGVTIGAGALVGAGAVVTRDVAPGRGGGAGVPGPLASDASATRSIDDDATMNGVLPPMAGPSRGAPVPFLDMKAQYAGIRDEVLEALHEVADSTTYVLGPRVAEFEEAFAAHVGSQALHRRQQRDLGPPPGPDLRRGPPGDEVITVPMTFVATSWAISYVGATPVFVDVDPVTYTMDVRQVERRITRRTRAILPVHLYGQPADMGPLLEIGRRRGIPVIEDAAQAHGARYQGRGAGTLGLCGCFSFYPGKNLGAYGEAGAVVTDDDPIAARLRALRDHAQSRRYHHGELGFNYRMDAFQGAVLGVKLKYLEAWTEARRRLAARYRTGWPACR